MQIRFLGKETSKTESPTLYATDRDSYIVQGWKIENPELRDQLAGQSSAPDDMFVEIWTKLFTHLAADGLHGEADPSKYPVVHTTGPKTCVVAGRPVTDAEVRAQMLMPDHEDCVEIDAAAMKALLRESTVEPDQP